jgi:hypothetical protein
MKKTKFPILLVIAVLAINFLSAENIFLNKIDICNLDYTSSLNTSIIKYFPAKINKNGFFYGKIDCYHIYDSRLNINVKNYSFYISNESIINDTLIIDIFPEIKGINSSMALFGYRKGSTSYSFGVGYEGKYTSASGNSINYSKIKYLGGISNNLQRGIYNIDIDIGLQIDDIRGERRIAGYISKNSDRPDFGINAMSTISFDDEIIDIIISGISSKFDFKYSDSLLYYNGESIDIDKTNVITGIAWSHNYSDYADLRMFLGYNYSDISKHTQNNIGDSSSISSVTHYLPIIASSINFNFKKDYYLNVNGNVKYNIEKSISNGNNILEKNVKFLYNTGIGYSSGDLNIIFSGERFIENILYSIREGELNLPCELRMYYNIDNLMGI